MKLIRCVVEPHQVDAVVDAVKAVGDIPYLTVTGGGAWRRRDESRKAAYRGCEYEVRLRPEVVIDVTTPDYAVEDVVKVVTEICGAGQPNNEAQILVMKVEDWVSIRSHQQRVA